MGLLDPKQVSTQDHLDIEDIREDLVVLKNGTVSLVIETTSVNFDLLANNEQDARILTFAGLLNSLNFPIQILIRTQQTDISKYINMLEDYKNKVGSDPLRQQVGIYQDFISNLISTSQILNKRFYVVVPTTTLLGARSNGLKSVFGKRERLVNVEEIVEKANVELMPKRDHILKQLGNMGLAARQLKNDELIKLYYSIYEPDKVGLEILNIREDAVEGAVVNTVTEADLARPASGAPRQTQTNENPAATQVMGQPGR